MFAPGITAYTVTVPNSVDSVTVTPTAVRAANSITVNDNPVNNGSPSEAIALNAGTQDIVIEVTALRDSRQTYTITVTRATTPIITGIELTSNAGDDGVYAIGDAIEATVTFSEAVIVTGRPQLALTVGPQTRQAVYARGSDSTELVFSYTVIVGDSDNDGVSIDPNVLTHVTDSTIQDAATATTDALLTHAAVADDPEQLVDGTIPIVAGVAISSTTGPYAADEVIELTAAFSEAVTVDVSSGTPQIPLTVGGTTRQAVYTGGSDTENLVFSYTVVAADRDDDGVEVTLNTLTASGGTIRDAAGNDALLDHAAIVATAANRVDTTVPTVSTATIHTNLLMLIYNEPLDESSVPAPTDYTLTRTLESDATVSTVNPDRVTIDGTTVALELPISVEIDDTVTLAYTAATNPVRDLAGNRAADLTSQDQEVLNNTEGPPVITAIELTSNGVYAIGDVIDATVRFSEAVDVSGLPQLPLTVGPQTPPAVYDPDRSTPTALVFSYTVIPGDLDLDGVSIGLDVLTHVADSRILDADAVDRNAVITHAAVTDNIAQRVDGVAPTVSLVLTPGPYVAGDAITLTATFSETVRVDLTRGTPRIPVIIGSTPRQAVYTGGSDTDNLVFSYTVVADDRDDDGVEVALNTLATGGGTIRDVVGNDALLDHAAVGANIANRVDTDVPTVISLTLTDGPYMAGDAITLTATFSETVEVDLTGGTPRIPVIIGSTPRQAVYTGGSDTDNLVFSYTVVAADRDDDGVEVAENTLTTAGSTIRDAIGNDALLDHAAIAATPANRVDNAAPTVSTATINDNILTLTYTEALDGNSLPAPTAWTLTLGSGTTALTMNPDGVAIVGTTVTLTLNAAVASSDAVTLAYTVGDNPVQDEVGNDAAGFIGLTVLNNTPGAILTGTLTEDTLNGATVTVTLENTEYAPETGLMPDDFSLTTDVPGLTVSGVSRDSDTAATLTLAYGGADITANGTLSVTVLDSGHTGSGGLDAGSILVTAVNPDLALTAPANQRYPINQAILSLTLLEASNAIGTATYTLTGPSGESLATAVPGLTFTPADRVLSGTPTAEGVTTLTYTVTDSATRPTATSVIFDVAVEVVPLVDSLTITSTGPYAIGEAIEVTVTFSETVTVDDTDDTPQITLIVGANSPAATYTSGTDSANLVFRYIVLSSDTDEAQVGIAANSLTVNGATIRDADGNDALLAHATVPTDPDHVVDTLVPTLSSASVNAGSLVLTYSEPLDEASAPTNDAYALTATPGPVPVVSNVTISGTEVTLALNEAITRAQTVTVSYTPGTPPLRDVAGNNAALLSTEAVTNNTPGAILTGTLTEDTLNGATVTVTLENTEYAPDELAAADFSLTTDVPGLTVSGVSRDSATAATLTLAYGGADITANGTLSVTVLDSGHTGSGDLDAGSIPVTAINPDLALTAPANQRYPINRAIPSFTLPGAIGVVETATYTLTGPSGESLATAVPGLTFTPADRVLSGTPTAEGVTTLTYTVTDSASSPATASVTFDVAVEVVPLVDSLTITSTGPYAIGEAIEVTVTFSESVTVLGGTPQITLIVGANSPAATYTSGTDSANLVFRYIVLSSDTDEAQVGIAANSLTVNGATIRDADGNDALLAHATVPTDPDHVVDTLVPTLSSASVNAGSLVLTYSEPLDEASAPTNDAYALTATPGPVPVVSNVTISGTEVTLALNEAITRAQTVTVSYTPGTPPLRDVAGNNAALLSTEAVTNNTPGAILTGTLTEDTLNGATVTVTLENTEYAPDELAAADFSLTTDVPGLTVSGVSRDSATAATLTLAYDGANITANGTLSVTVLDSGHTGSGALTTNSVPIMAIIDVITGTTTGAVTEDDPLATANGQLTLAGDFVAQLVMLGTYGTFDLAATGAWTYRLDNTPVATLPVDSTPQGIATNALAADVTVTDVFTVVSATDPGVTQAVTITVTGADDPAIIVGRLTGTVTEDELFGGFNRINGGLEVLDPDSTTLPDGFPISNGGFVREGEGSAFGTYGTFVFLNPRFPNRWFYDVDNENMNLIEGAIVTDEFIVGFGNPDFTANRDLRTTVTITITGVNDAPSAEAGAAQTVAEGALVTLDGTGSDDEDAGDQAALGYQWAQVADPPTVTFTGADTDTATFSAPLVDADTQLTFTLTVTDPQTATDTDTVVVTVRADAEASLAGTLTEDTLNGATVTVTLANTEYAPETELMPDDFRLTTDVPGLTVSGVSRDSATAATLTLAYDGTNITVDGTLSVTVLESGHTGSGDLTTDSILVTAVNPDLALTAPANQRYPINQAILSLTLLEASNAIGTATYTLTGPSGESLATAVPGLTFTPVDRALSGTPTAEGVTTLTYTVTDSASSPATASVTFDVAVEVVPLVDSLTITSTGPYAIGEAIEVTVTFSESVTVLGGTPQITLIVGANSPAATYTSGTDSANLVFRYIVLSSDTDEAQVGIAANSLTVNGATIRDADGNDALLAHATVPTDPDHVVDTLVPTLSSASVNAGSLVLTYSEPLDEASAPTNDAYALTATPGPVPVVSNVTISGTEVTLALNEAITRAQTVTVSYTPGTPPLRDVAGNNAALLSTEAVTNNTPGAILTGTLTEDTLNGATVTVTLENTEYAPDELAAADFSLTTDVPGLTVSGVSRDSATAATLTLAYGGADITANGTLSVTVLDSGHTGSGGLDAGSIPVTAINPDLALTAPANQRYPINRAIPSFTLPGAIGVVETATYTLTGPSGESLATAVPGLTFTPVDRVLSGTPTAEGVTTLTYTVTDSASSPATASVTFDVAVEVVPLVDSLTITSTGPYAIGEAIEVTVTFSETVTVLGGTPQLTLIVGTTRPEATYTSGTGSANLVFTYAVQASDTDGAQVGIEANTLAAVGATIRDADGNDALLAHATVPIDPDHVVDTVVPTFSSASVNAGSLVLTYSESLDEAAVPANGAYVLTATPGPAPVVSNVTISGTEVTLALNAAITRAQTVTVSYTPGTPPLRDVAGNNAALLSTGAVTNNTPAGAILTGTLNEGSLNGATVTVTLENTEYEGSLSTDNFTLTPQNVPGLLSVNTVSRDSGTLATLTLAYRGGDITANGTLSVTVLDSGHTGSGDLVTNSVPIMAIIGTTTGEVTEDATDDTESGSLSGNFEAQTGGDATTGIYGGFELAATGEWTYTLDNDDRQTDALAAGVTRTEVFTAVSAADNSLTQAVTITVTGANDVAEITGTLERTLRENVVLDDDDPSLAVEISGLLNVDDPDSDSEGLDAQVTFGTYGTFRLRANGLWRYILSASADPLTDGTDVTDEFTVQTFECTIDPDDADCTTATIIITIIGENDPPAISGVVTGGVTEDAPTSSVIGTLSVTDPDSPTPTLNPQTTAGTYGSFELTAAGEWTYTLDNQRDATNALAQGGINGTDEFTVTATDSIEESAETVTITVTGANDAPSANAGAARSVAEGTSVTLDGTGSRDQDAGDQASLTYQWTPPADTPPVTLTDANTATPSFTAPEVAADTPLTFTLTVTDSQTASGTATVVVTVRAAAAVLAGTLTEDTLDGATVTVTLANTEYAPDELAAADFRLTTDVPGLTVSGVSRDSATAATLTLAYGGEDLTANGTLSVTVLDSGHTGSGALTTNSVPIMAIIDVITGTTTGAVTEDDPLAATANGQLTLAGDFVAQLVMLGTYGTFDLAATGAWTYRLDNTPVATLPVDSTPQGIATNALAADVTVTDVFTVVSATDPGVTQAVTITVTGADDPAMIVGRLTGTVTEDELFGGFNRINGGLEVLDPDSTTLPDGFPISNGGFVREGEGSAFGTYGTLRLPKPQISQPMVLRCGQ